MRGEFGKAAQGIQSGADAKAKAAAADLAKVKAGLGPAEAGRATWDNGSGDPTAANFLSGGDVANLHAIGSVLGDQSLMGAQAAGPYVAGHWNDPAATFDGDKSPGNPTVGQASMPKGPYIPSTKEVADATRGMTAEQKAEYARIHQEYPAMAPAQIAEDVRTGTSKNQQMFGGHAAPVGSNTNLMNLNNVR